MFTWAEIVLLLLKIADAIIQQANQDKWVKAGSDAAIAKMAASVLAKTEAGKKMMEKVNAMSDYDVDAELRKLEPGGM